MPAPSRAVQDAINRRGATAGTRAVRIEWFIKNVSDKIEMTMKERIQVAVDFLLARIVNNISVPVTIGKSKTGKRIVTGRSKPGEFPRAETGNLMRTLVKGVEKAADGEWEGYVGTPLLYGAVLEMSERLDRTYMRRTYEEEKEKIKRLLTGPISS